MSELFLGIDVGTYSSKGILTDVTGRIVDEAVVQHDMDVPEPGWAEQDADGVWWNDVVELCHELVVRASRDPGTIAGVGVSAIGPCLLPLDEDGHPLRKGILYGVDTRATEEGEELTAAIGRDELLRFSKMAFTSQAIGPKIVWLQRHQPETWRRTERLTTASAYLTFRLTGEHVIDRHTASHYMPLIDMETLEWSDAYADLVAPTSMLPRLGWSDERAGTVTERAAAETGLKVGTPVAVGAVDALSEALSVGVRDSGDMMIMYGSTAFFILLVDTPVKDERVWSTAGAFEGQYALAAGMSTTGSVTRWIRDEFARELEGDEGYATLFAEAGASPHGANGLLLLPYFSGERTPINDPRARGVLAGLSLKHVRGDIFRAALEGVAHGIRHNIETFDEIGADARRLVAVGGGVRGDLWPQIVSDVSGRSQDRPEVTVGASYGDAFLAACAAGYLAPSDLPSWIRVERRIDPDPDARKIYERLHPHFRELYTATRDVVHSIEAVSHA